MCQTPPAAAVAAAVLSQFIGDNERAKPRTNENRCEKLEPYSDQTYMKYMPRSVAIVAQAAAIKIFSLCCVFACAFHLSCHHAAICQQISKTFRRSIDPGMIACELTCLPTGPTPWQPPTLSDTSHSPAPPLV